MQLSLVNKFCAETGTDTFDSNNNDHMVSYTEWLENQVLQTNTNKTTGIGLVTSERKKQIEKGYTVIKDVANYSFPTGPFRMLPFNILVGNLMGIIGGVPYPDFWSDEAIEKIKAKNRIEKLTIAGSFICAEIDRLIAIKE